MMQGDGDSDGMGLAVAEANRPVVKVLRGRDLLRLVVQHQFWFAPHITHYLNICPVHIADTCAQSFAHGFLDGEPSGQTGHTSLTMGLLLDREEAIQEPLPMPGKALFNALQLDHIYPGCQHNERIFRDRRQ